MKINEKLGLQSVINASGKMTILGVSKVSDKVAESQKEAGQNFFVMADLVEKSGYQIARLLNTENATVVSSASAGIALSVAAVIGQGNLYHLYHPYSTRINKREIIIPKGHNVNYGTGVEVMVNLGGGKLIEAGWANECRPEQIEMEIREETAALLFVKSHHSVQKSMLSISDMARIAKKHKIPLIIDAAAEEDLYKYYAEGGDLVIYSGAKAIQAPTSAIVLGKDHLIKWVQLQNKGIGRAMKVGKENIIACLSALEEYLEHGSESKEQMISRLTPFIEQMNQIQGLEAHMVQDGAGREIYRAAVTVKNAKQVVEALKEGETAIYTREYKVNDNIIEFDIRAVDKKEMQQIIDRLQQIMEE